MPPQLAQAIAHRRPAISVGLLCLVLCGCATAPMQPSDEPSQFFPSGPYTTAPAYGLSPAQSRLLVALRNYYRQWADVPYRYGGTSRAGIDCSAFVEQVMAATRGVSLPRTTRAQARRGRRISPRRLRIGDLVFFKTGGGSRHVGIYVGNDRFMHVSSSVGVTISSLHNIYWRQHFWQARRIAR